jgi:hypothetical protein
LAYSTAPYKSDTYEEEVAKEGTPYIVNRISVFLFHVLESECGFEAIAGGLRNHAAANECTVS